MSRIPATGPEQVHVVVMDNLGSYEGKAVRWTTRQAGAKLIFLNKYPRDLNPIEQLFAKLKALLRKAAEQTAEETLHRDAVSAGCYFMLGARIFADMNLIDQMQPHTPTRFVKVDVNTALQARADRRAILAKVREALA